MWQWNRHGFESQETSIWLCGAEELLFLGSFFFPEQPGGGDSYFQCTGVSTLAKGVGTKPAHNRQTTNSLLSPLQDEVSSSM